MWLQTTNSLKCKNNFYAIVPSMTAKSMLDKATRGTPGYLGINGIPWIPGKASGHTAQHHGVWLLTLIGQAIVRYI